MPVPVGIDQLAARLVEVERQLRGANRSARLQFSTVGVAVDDTDDGPVVDLDVSGALWTGVEAGVDAQTALDVARFNVGGARYATTADRDAALPDPSPGMRVYVADVNLDYQFSAGQWVPLLQYVKKTVAQTYAGTTFAADPELRLALVPGSYRIESFLHTSGPTAGDVKIAWSFGGTFDGGARSALGMAIGESDPAQALMRTASTSLTDPAWYGTTPAAISVIREDIYLRVITAGILQLWVAQYVAGAGTPVTVSAASRLYITKVN